MPKVNASLKDISTEYVPPAPDTYEFKVEDVKEKEMNEGGIYRQQFDIKSVIDSDGEHKGKPLTVQISVHKKDGDLNTAGLADLKRFFEAIAPEEAESEEPDPDILKGGRFMADVYHEKFIYKSGPNQGKEGIAARINTGTISAI